MNGGSQANVSRLGVGTKRSNVFTARIHIPLTSYILFLNPRSRFPDLPTSQVDTSRPSIAQMTPLFVNCDSTFLIVNPVFHWIVYALVKILMEFVKSFKMSSVSDLSENDCIHNSSSMIYSTFSILLLLSFSTQETSTFQ